jgi:hypothetical protein
MVMVLEIGLFTLAAGYVFGLISVSKTRERIAGSVILVFALVFRLTLLLLPGLFSTDIFSYVMAGRIAAVYAGNPYVQVPADFPEDPFLAWVFPFWRDTPTVYGPAWTDVSWVLGRLTGNWPNFDQVLAYRLSLFVVELLVLWIVSRLLRASLADATDGRNYRTSLCLFAWNPLWLVDIVGNAHNDGVMVVLLLAGVFLACRQHPFLSVTAMTLGAMVKYSSAVALVLWIVAWSARAGTLPLRWSRAAAASAVMGILILAVAWPWVAEPAALASLGGAAEGRVTINNAADVVALAVANRVVLPASKSDLSPTEASARTWTRMLMRALFAAYCAWEIARVWRNPRRSIRATLEAPTRALLLLPFALTGAVWSWYFTWSLALAVLLGARSWLARLVVLYTIVMPPMVYAQQYLNEAFPRALVVMGTLAPLIIWAGWYWRVRAAYSSARLSEAK